MWLILRNSRSANAFAPTGSPSLLNKPDPPDGHRRPAHAWVAQLAAEHPLLDCCRDRIGWEEYPNHGRHPADRADAGRENRQSTQQFI
jgi:hypothetical protein